MRDAVIAAGDVGDPLMSEADKVIDGEHGAGNIVTVADDTEVPPGAAGQCYAWKCSNQMPMIAPANQGQEAIRDGVARLFKSIRTLDPAEVVRGQFGGYLAEEGVAPDSQVETFTALRFHIDSWRWAGVPVDVRVGKNLPVTCTAVTVFFKPPPQQVFQGAAPHANFLRLHLTPGIMVTLGLNTKRPGAGMTGESAELVLHRQAWDGMAPYERLLGDALAGDATLFARQDEVEEDAGESTTGKASLTPLRAGGQGEASPLRKPSLPLATDSPPSAKSILAARVGGGGRHRPRGGSAPAPVQVTR